MKSAPYRPDKRRSGDACDAESEMLIVLDRVRIFFPGHTWIIIWTIIHPGKKKYSCFVYKHMDTRLGTTKISSTFWPYIHIIAWDIWNSLPEDLINCTTLASFKRGVQFVQLR